MRDLLHATGRNRYARRPSPPKFHISCSAWHMNDILYASAGSIAHGAYAWSTKLECIPSKMLLVLPREAADNQKDKLCEKKGRTGTIEVAGSCWLRKGLLTSSDEGQRHKHQSDAIVKRQSTSMEAFRCIPRRVLDSSRNTMTGG